MNRVWLISKRSGLSAPAAYGVAPEDIFRQMKRGAV